MDPSRLVPLVALVTGFDIMLFSCSQMSCSINPFLRQKLGRRFRAVRGFVLIQ